MQRPVMLLTATLVAVAVAVPSVASETNLANSKLCKRLCNDGLGGKRCGCDPDKVAKNLTQTMYNWRTNHPEDKVIKGPRWHLCLVLCHLGLGQPLCGCGQDKPSIEDHNEVCKLCELATPGNEIYNQLKCDRTECSGQSLTNPKFETNENLELVEGPLSIKFLESMVDWNLWCTIQCDEGDGGIACNCDMLPLKVEGNIYAP